MKKKIGIYELLKKPIQNTLFLIRKTLHKGSKNRCNICENNFKRFLPINVPFRPNVRCPYCNSTESDRVLWFYLSNEILTQKNKKKFLYVEPHPEIFKKLNLKGIGPDLERLDYFTNAKFDNSETRLRGGTFDVVIFSQQLQFVKNDEAILAELKRLLRTGGTLLVQTIVHPEMDRTYEHISTPEDRDRLKEYYEPGTESIYGVNFHKHLRRAGFKVTVIDFAQQLGEGAIEYYRLGTGERETIYQCKKP
jgi:SAM-dependent methyltransferase